jgi:hypothetical protein
MRCSDNRLKIYELEQKIETMLHMEMPSKLETISISVQTEDMNTMFY